MATKDLDDRHGRVGRRRRGDDGRPHRSGRGPRGLYVIKTEAYGPQIRGGESSCTVRISADPIPRHGDLVDALVVFNWADFGRFRGESGPGPGCPHPLRGRRPDPREEMKQGMPEGSRWIPVRFTKLAKEATGGGPGQEHRHPRNPVRAFDLPGGSSAPPSSTGSRRRARRSSRSTSRPSTPAATSRRASPSTEHGGSASSTQPGEPMLLISGNEPSAVGALHAGCRFFAGYPITPSSEVLALPRRVAPRVGGTSIQTEDELAGARRRHRRAASPASSR